MSGWPVMACGNCDGHGIVTNTFTGEPDDCRPCGGSGLERARDSRGRYMKATPDAGRDGAKAASAGAHP